MRVNEDDVYIYSGEVNWVKMQFLPLNIWKRICKQGENEGISIFLMMVYSGSCDILPLSLVQ